MLPRPPAARRALHTEGELIAFMRLYRHGGPPLALTLTGTPPHPGPAPSREAKAVAGGGDGDRVRGVDAAAPGHVETDLGADGLGVDTDGAVEGVADRDGLAQAQAGGRARGVVDRTPAIDLPVGAAGPGFGLACIADVADSRVAPSAGDRSVRVGGRVVAGEVDPVGGWVASGGGGGGGGAAAGAPPARGGACGS